MEESLRRGRLGTAPHTPGERADYPHGALRVNTLLRDCPRFFLSRFFWLALSAAACRGCRPTSGSLAQPKSQADSERAGGAAIDAAILSVRGGA